MKRKSIKTQVKEFFFTNPTIKLRVRQIERELKLPLPSILRYTKELTEETILKRIETSGVVFFSANRSSKMYLLEKKLYNIKKLYNVKLVDFLIEELSNPAIILFGSYSKGEDVENSDVDLYIQTVSTKKIDTKKFEVKLKRKIQIFKYKTIFDVTNMDLANNIINGVNLNGNIEVFKSG
jgi:predicted nucleotidyltransferase